MPVYKVLRAIRTEDGRVHKTGDTVELTERQAKYPVLGGVIAPAAAAPKKRKPKPADPADPAPKGRAKDERKE